MTIDVFLSSNSRSGYSRDVVDLFAKPTGAKHQFRYDSRWISDEVLDRVKVGTYRAQLQAVLCYVDQTTKNVPPLVVPVRFATIAGVREHGTTKSIVFRLGKFCKFADLTAFNTTARKTMREWPDYVNGKLSGKYWLVNDESAFEEIGSSSDLGDWERLVAMYYETPNPIENMPFYRFEGIFDLKSDKEVEPTREGDDLLYTLSGGTKYEARVYHYHPKDDFPEYTLKVMADDGNLVSLNGDSRVLHTRYDRKDYRFETKRIILGADSLLAFRRAEKDSGKLIWEDFLLKVKIAPSRKYAFVYVVTVAVSFAIPFIVRNFTDPDSDWPVTMAAIVGGLGVGAATLFKEKVRL